MIIPEIDVTPFEQSNAFTYYMAAWKADGNKTDEAAALSAFHLAVGNARAESDKACISLRKPTDRIRQSPTRAHKCE